MSTTPPVWEDVEVQSGSFIGWGNAPGQVLTLKVVTFDPLGGNDFNNQPCPKVVGTTVEPFTNYREKGTVTEQIAADELVTLKCGQANLKNGINSAQPKGGDLVRIEFTSLEKVDKGTMKVFKVQIARATHTPVDGDLI